MQSKDEQNTITLPTVVRVLMPNGHVEDMKLESYLAGAVAAEIGMHTPLEALKAQAVASRTYVANAYRHPEKNADVCTTSHCQKWKRVDPVVAPEIYRALSETWGLVALHNGKLIDAFFFEHCDGHTRSSEVMMMPAIPYLRGVGCRCGFLDMKGHGVGMCKRGASVMAREGALFEQILKHYYRGIKVFRAISEPPVAESVVPEPPTPAERILPPPEAMKPRPTPPPAKKEPAPRRLHTHQIEAEKPIKQASPTHTPVARHTTPTHPRPKVASHHTPAPAPAQTQPQPTTPPITPPVTVRPIPQPTPVKQRRVHIDHLPGHRMIAGSLEAAGIPITVTDPHGNRTTVMSGNAPHYGEGGFETIALEDGSYLVSIEGQITEVTMQGETVFIHAH